MSEELENSVREMLKEETWTRATISNFTKNDMVELEGILEKAKNENCENAIQAICNEHLEQHKDSSIIAMYLSGMISLKQGNIELDSLESLVDLFEKNHKDSLIEYLCESILNEDPNNKFALRKLAAYYKSTNDDKLYDVYEKIVKIDFEEADIAKLLAERFESQGNSQEAVSYYKKAILRYISAKNYTAIKEIWTRLVHMIPEEKDFLLLVQRKIAKALGDDRSIPLIQELYDYYKATAKWDVAVELLKIILSIDNTDSWARKELVECYREKYAGHSRLEDYIRASNLTASYRNVFEAINDFEKHISFDVKSFVFHRTLGVGVITKVEGENLFINFGKKNENVKMTLSMAVSALQPLPKDHFWVIKACVSKDKLAKKVKENVAWTLKRIIKSYDNNCDDKHIKAELVPGVLTPGEWTSWHAKAQTVFATDQSFGVNSSDINFHTVLEHPLTREERYSNEFKAEKLFFARIDVLKRYVMDDEADKTDDMFIDMFNYFSSYLKAFSTVDEQVVASYLIVQEVSKSMPRLAPKLNFTFAQMYDEIENPKELYTNLKDSKNTNLKELFLANVKNLPDWTDQYIKLFPIVLKKSMLLELVNSGNTAKVTKLVQDCFNDYRNYREAVICLFKECRNEDWFKSANISEEKQLVTLTNIITLCYREINSHVNTTDNKKIIKSAQTLLFEEKAGDGKKNNMLDYMMSKDTETITRMYTIVNDIKDLDTSYATQLRNAILEKYPDYKFPEKEIKQETPKGILVTSKMLEAKRVEADHIEKVLLPEIAEEVALAKEKGDLKENAEYSSAKEKQSQLNNQLMHLRADLAKAVVFDPTTVTTSFVSFGTTVLVHDNIGDKDISYTILGQWEANPSQGIINYLSPVGDALLDSKVGDTVAFEISGKQISMTVKEIKIANV